MSIVILKPGREKPLIRKHPWIFSGSVETIKGSPEAGDLVEIRDHKGKFLAYGAFSPESQIRVRVWSWDRADAVGPDFLRARLLTAISFRKYLAIHHLLSPLENRELLSDLGLANTAVRLVHAESDGLPGLIVDQYADTLVMQVLSVGMEYWRDLIADSLLEMTNAQHVYERSDAEVRQLEGLPTRVGPIRGNPANDLIIIEDGLLFKVAINSGHKTGFYLDQRKNRRLLRELSKGKEVLDCFTYTGGFTLNSLVGGATAITAVDVSSQALDLARENVSLNNLPGDKVEWLENDVFHQLRKFRDQGRQFDLIVLDPPKFAPTISQVRKASRGYKDINLLAFKLLRPGGVLVTFSCSGGVERSLFQKIVADAALDAGVDAQIIEHLEQSSDHPVGLNFPEGAYLKGLIVRTSG